MREALFIKQNSAKWKEYEDTPAGNPDILAERFIIISDDLAYAKTFYPKSKTTSYLNGLAAGFHQSIYRNKKEKANRFVYFWQYELPLVFKQYHRQILYSFLFFTISFFIGVLSAKYDNSFVRLIMGDDYVNMTNENIAKGDPLGVYKSHDSFIMFWLIAKNNITVMVQTFVLGITYSVGTIAGLFYNGVMVGSFQYYFISKGVGLASIGIWIHGTIEISTIILSGAAGLILGNSILFPKTYTRFVSLKRGAKDGMKIALGIVPIIVTAAIFEGFVTRHTEMPLWLSVTILGASLSFIIWYVVLYPIHLTQTLNKKTNNHAGEDRAD